jgi:hypothetical protein
MCVVPDQALHFSSFVLAARRFAAVSQFVTRCALEIRPADFHVASAEWAAKE